MTMGSNQPSGKRPVPGIPSKQLWDSSSFRTPEYFVFPWHGLGGVRHILIAMAAGAGVLFALHVLGFL